MTSGGVRFVPTRRLDAVVVKITSVIRHHESPSFRADNSAINELLLDRCVDRSTIYSEDVFRRLSSVVLALLLVATPVAAAICDAACAGHAHMAGDMAVGHTPHHHDSMATPEHDGRGHGAVSTIRRDAASRIQALPRVCDRVGAVKTARIERSPLAPHSLAARSVVAVVEVDTSPPLARRDNRHGPPSPARSIPPLRI
jgi:hypothetical protein